MKSLNMGPIVNKNIPKRWSVFQNVPKCSGVAMQTPENCEKLIGLHFGKTNKQTNKTKNKTKQKQKTKNEKKNKQTNK